MEFEDLVDAEQPDGTPREGNRVRDATFKGVPRFGRRGLHIRAAERGDERADRRVGRPYLHTADLGGQENLLLGVKSARVMDEGEAIMHVLHLGGRVATIPGIEGGRTGMSIGDEKRQFAGSDDRESTGLVA